MSWSGFEQPGGACVPLLPWVCRLGALALQHGLVVHAVARLPWDDNTALVGLRDMYIPERGVHRVALPVSRWLVEDYSAEPLLHDALQRIAGQMHTVRRRAGLAA